MATDWPTEALPVLQAVYDVQREGGHLALLQGVQSSKVIERVDLDEQLAGSALLDLTMAGYLSSPFGTDNSLLPPFVLLTEKGLKAVASWPAVAGAGSYEAIVAALEERISRSEDDSERSRWQRVRDALIDLGRSTVTDLLAEVAAGRIPH